MQRPDPHGDGAGRRRLFGAAALSVGERIVSQVAQFSVFVVAARILGPAEFGVFALVSACAILLLKVAEVGWAPFIMSHSGNETVPLQVLFIAILNGIGFGVAGGLAALAAGRFGLAQETVLLLVLFSLWVVLANASSAQKGVLIWMDRMAASAACEIVGEAIGAAVSVFALLQGAGVFALVYGRLACQTTVLALSFVVTRRAPVPRVSAALLRDLWSFSGQIFVSRMLVHVRLHFVTLIVGGFLGPASAGYFRAAERLVGSVSEVIAVPGQLLAWTQFRKARDLGPPAERTERINAQVARHLKVLVLLGVPPFLWVILMGGELVGGLLGEDWRPAAPLVAILALGRVLLIPGILTEPLMSITGEARRLPLFMALIFAVSVALTAGTAGFGVHAVTWGQAVTSLVALVATVRLFAHHAGIRWGPVMADLRSTLVPLGVGGGTIALLDWAATGRGIPDLVEALTFPLIGCVTFATAIAVADPAVRGLATACFRPAALTR